MSAQRYTRQTTLKGFGVEAQTKLSNAKVLVVGTGGLGIPVLTYLNAMGVGILGFMDADKVSISNLHRQVLYDESDVGLTKVKVVERKLKAQNSGTKLIAYNDYLTSANVFETIKNYDMVVDATDNFPTRYLINDACIILDKPFVYGALHGYEGQVSVFNHNGGPTYRCLFPDMPKANEVPNCNEHGVLGVIPGIVGNLQALEAVKVITGVGETLSGKLLLYNGLSQTVQKIKFSLIPENKKIKELRTSYDFECKTEIKEIEAIEVKQLIENQQIIVIDVRSKEEYTIGHLESTKNIPLDELETRFPEIELHQPIYLICQSGIRSKKAVDLLQELLPEQEFINVRGGMNQLLSHANTY